MRYISLELIENSSYKSKREAYSILAKQKQGISVSKRR